MADTKLSALTALTALTGDELFYVVEDDDGTPVSRGITVENLATGLAGRTELTSVFAALINTDSNAGRKIYVGSVDPDVSYTPVTGDVWIEV